MSNRKKIAKRDELAAAYGKFVLAVASLLELRDLGLLNDEERELVDKAYCAAGDAQSAFSDRTGANKAWMDEIRDRSTVRLIDNDPAPIVEPAP
jgi:hypothetical protein